MAIEKAVLLRVADWHVHQGKEKQSWWRKEKNNYLRLSYHRDYTRHFRISHELRVQAYGSAQ